MALTHGRRCVWLWVYAQPFGGRRMEPCCRHSRAGRVRILIGIELDAAAVFGLLARGIAVHLGNVGAFVLAHAIVLVRVFDGELPVSAVSVFLPELIRHPATCPASS